MSVYNLFDETFCILSSDKSLDKLRNIVDQNVKMKFFETYKSNFHSHIDIIQYAYKNELQNIIVFDDKSVIRNDIHFLKDIHDYIYNNDYDVILLSSNILNQPTSNAIIYNISALETILHNYIDFIDLMDYDTYLLKYSDLNCHICNPILFYKNDVFVNLYYIFNNNIVLKLVVLFCILCFVRFVKKIK